MVTFFQFSLARVNNQEFLGFMLNFQKLLLDGDRETLGVAAADFVAFNKKVQDLVDQVYSTGTLALTQAINAADQKRSQLYKKIRAKLKVCEYAEEGSALLGCKTVVMTELIAKYKADVAMMPMQEKTGVLHGFIYDLRQKLSESNIEALGIEDDITMLETANNDFMEKWDNRVTEKVAIAEVKTKLIREDLLELYNRICAVVVYNANNLSGEKDNDDTVQACKVLTDKANILLQEVKLRFDTRTKKKGSAEDDPEGGDTEGGNQQGGGNTNTEGGGNTQGGTNTEGGNTQGGSNTGGGTNTGTGDKEPDDGGVINGGNVEW